MTNDPFLYDTELLHAIADGETIKRGLSFFNENRVLDLNKDGERLTAQVEDASDDVYWVALNPGEDGALHADCDCRADRAFCEHALAVLYAYADQYGGNTAAIGSAVDEAIQERVNKGRNEVRVRLLSGNLGFGTWLATSLVSATHWQRSYHVQIRSLEKRMNYCTCPDLSSNRLGTCKHIEAVLHHARKSPEYQRFKAQGCQQSLVYLAWESAVRPVIRLQRAAEVADSLESLFGEFFDGENRFQGRLPEDFSRFSQQAAGRDDLLLGDDAAAYARQCAADAEQAARGAEISHAILQSHGVLPGIRVRLFPYQTEGVAFLAARGRALLADDMGLGKTLQAISAACWLADNAAVNRVLVICPASLKHQWAREIGRFTGKSVQVIQGAADSRGVQYRADALFFIVNYELLLRDLTVINSTLKPDLLVLDEAQRIKNWRTKLASTVKQIPSRYAFVLTGTPLENRLEDLYSLLQLVDSRVLGPLWRCLLDFHITDERGKVVGYRNLSELRRRIAPVVLRRSRTLVSDQLPDRTEVVLDIPMSDKQQELHDSALQSAGQLANIARTRPLTPSEQNRLMAALQQARMACNAAGLVDKETRGAPKLDELARLLDELCVQSNRKAVVFSQWQLMTAMVETLVREMGLGCVHLHGGVPTGKRGELMERFQNDDALQVFISTDAGGVGLNLQSASVLINLDMPWNPAVLDQRIARIHRLGQKQKVQIFLLLAADSYEQHVARLVQGKRDLFDNVIDENATEDVVGISKKMLETLIDDLAPVASPSAARDADTVPSPAAAPETAAAAATQTMQPDAAEADAAIRQTVANLQTVFGGRIERILARSGSLLAVVEHWQENDEQLAQQLSTSDLPVAVIDARALRSLQQLGAGSPLAEGRTVFAPAAQPAENSLSSAAAQKLHAAEILLQQECPAGVMDLTASAVLLKLTALCGQHQPPALSMAPVWLYSDIVPRNLLTPPQLTLALQVIALSQSPAVPESLVRQSVAEVRQLFADLG